MTDNLALTINELTRIFAAGEDKDTIAAVVKSVKDGTEKRKAAAQIVRRYEREEKERQRVRKMYDYERGAAAEGYTVVAGVDEAGRGPLAGPVSVAAVILPPELYLPGLNDSKKLSAKKREELYLLITEQAVCVRQVFVAAEEIDRMNILQATMAGMYKAIAALAPAPQKVLIDAVKLEKLSVPSLSIIKGDAVSASIAAASIIAKVARDRLMDEYDRRYPQYGFAAHKGYGTAEHIAAIQKYGICPLHRRTFEPIRSMFCNGRPK